MKRKWKHCGRGCYYAAKRRGSADEPLPWTARRLRWQVPAALREWLGDHLVLDDWRIVRIFIEEAE